MHIERVTLSNFRCFGHEPLTATLAPTVTAFIGANGSGKTALLQALARLFGITNDQRRVRRQDFHVPSGEQDAPPTRSLFIEVLLGFPELRESTESSDSPDAVDGPPARDLAAVPDFFRHMAIDEEGDLKVRLRMDAEWVDDGSAEGIVQTTYRAVRTLDADFTEDDCSAVPLADRSLIQMVYLPSMRDGDSQVQSVLRGRLWRAVSWSDTLREAVEQSGGAVNAAFNAQRAVGTITSAVRNHWLDLAGNDAYGEPEFRPVAQSVEDLVRRVDVLFSPSQPDRVQDVGELSDGHRSLFHIGMSLALVDVEERIRAGATEGFVEDRVGLPALTLIALEEPENSLSPFYLSRIVGQLLSTTGNSAHVQSMLSSHSPGLVGRIDPENIRYFRLDERVSNVRGLSLPDGEGEAGKFVRQAVRAYPELYFARFVILGEGASEAIVIPRIAAAKGVHIDPSFVAVVPLGGRHVNHLWKLLSDLRIPHATLLDLDAGRAGGGWRRVRTVCEALVANGTTPEALFPQGLIANSVEETLKALSERELTTSIVKDIRWLREFGVYFAAPLDLDLMMLSTFTDAYKALPDDRRGPRLDDAARRRAEEDVLGEGRESAPYTNRAKGLFPWYRYLFLHRSKPGTHLRALNMLSDEQIAPSVPEALAALIERVRDSLPDVPRPDDNASAR